MYCQCTKDECVCFAITKGFSARCHKWHCKTIIFLWFPFPLQWSVITNNNQMKASSWLSRCLYQDGWMTHGTRNLAPRGKAQKVRGPLPLQGSYLMTLLQSCQSNVSARNTDFLWNGGPTEIGAVKLSDTPSNVYFHCHLHFVFRSRNSTSSLHWPILFAVHLRQLQPSGVLCTLDAKDTWDYKVELPSSTLHVSVTVGVLFSLKTNVSWTNIFKFIKTHQPSVIKKVSDHSRIKEMK